MNQENELSVQAFIIQPLLETRIFVYDILRRAFLEEPAKEFLKLIMNNQERIIKRLNIKAENVNDSAVTQTSKEFNSDESTKIGSTEGETQISGDIDDEVLAVIMASVSEYTKIPLKSLKIKSIKKL
jgi:hypothetical protein